MSPAHHARKWLGLPANCTNQRRERSQDPLPQTLMPWLSVEQFSYMPLENRLTVDPYGSGLTSVPVLLSSTRAGARLTGSALTSLVK
jgi:hypothetical protein